MKVAFEEIVSRKEWLHKELLSSLTGDIINKAKEEGFYDIKLLVNGEELEPNFYNSLVEGISKYVEDEAKKYLQEKLEDAEQEAYNLLEIIKTAKENIEEKYNIE